MTRRLIVLFFALFSLFLLFPNNSHAQESTFTVKPPLEEINDYLSTVSVTFQGDLIDSLSVNDLYICMEQDLCIDDDDVKDGIFEGNLEYVGQATRGLTDDQVDEKTLQRYKFDDESKTIIVCGDGDSKLKTPERFTNGNGSKECAGDENGENNDKDYFYPGSVYLLSLYQKAGDVFILHTVAGFFVNHGVPEMTVSPSNNLTPGGKFTVNVSSPKIRNNGNGDKKNRNNYQIIVDGPGMRNDVLHQAILNPGNNQSCISFSAPGEQVTKVFPTDEEGVTLAGDYVIRLREQINESHNYDDCLGGFVYAEIHCHVGIPGSDPTANVCGDPIIDPEGKDLNSMAQLFVELGLSSGGTRLPCAELKDGAVPDPLHQLPGRENDVTNPADCAKIETALGTIGLDLDEFVLSIFTYVLSIAGVAALLLIIYGGYNYMVSRGDPEKIKHAREIITAAIIGLLFIIFSFVILQVIAGDILQIPGFNEPENTNETSVDMVDDETVSDIEFPPPNP